MKSILLAENIFEHHDISKTSKFSCFNWIGTTLFQQIFLKQNFFFQKRGRLPRFARAFGPLHLRRRRLCSLPDRPVNLDGLNPVQPVNPDYKNPDNPQTQPTQDGAIKHWTIFLLSFSPSESRRRKTTFLRIIIIFINYFCISVILPPLPLVFSCILNRFNQI